MEQNKLISTSLDSIDMFSFWTSFIRSKLQLF